MNISSSAQFNYKARRNVFIGTSALMNETNFEIECAQLVQEPIRRKVRVPAVAVVLTEISTI